MKEDVRNVYKNIARGNSSLTEKCCCSTDKNFYEEYLKDLPEEASFESYGCGTPLAFEAVRKGEKVLDIGSGEGLEVIIAAKMAGSDGFAAGLDFTSEMLNKARDNARKCGMRNTEFVKGDAENIPYPDLTFNLVISNCVINLVEDKKKAICEIYRILKPNGRAVISDIVSEKPIPDEFKNDPKIWSSCIGGAIPIEDYLQIFISAGFSVPKMFDIREISYRKQKLFSITFKAVKLPQHLKINIGEPLDNFFVFPDAGYWLKADEENSKFFRKLSRGVDKKRIKKENEKEIISELSFRNLISEDKDTNYKNSRKSICPQLKEVWLHLNQKCNLRCRYCLVEAGEEVETPLTTGEVEKIVKSAASLGAKRFYITGGEPYLRKDIEQIFKVVMDYGELVILTNATLLKENSYIPSPKKSLYQISLDGTKKINDYLRGNNSFDRTISGIKRLMEDGHQPVIASVVTTYNLENLIKLNKYLGSLGIKNHHLLFAHNRGRARHEMGIIPPAEKIIEMLDTLIEKSRNNGVSIVNYLAFKSRLNSSGKALDLCHAGIEMLVVGPRGEIYPCPSLVGRREFIAGSLRKDGLEELWNNNWLLEKIRTLSLYDSEKCTKCSFRCFCGGGCLAFKYVRSGKFRAPDPYCDIYRYLLEKSIPESNCGGVLFSPSVRPAGKREGEVFNCN